MCFQSNEWSCFWIVFFAKAMYLIIGERGLDPLGLLTPRCIYPTNDWQKCNWRSLELEGTWVLYSYIFSMISVYSKLNSVSNLKSATIETGEIILWSLLWPTGNWLSLTQTRSSYTCLPTTTTNHIHWKMTFAQNFVGWCNQPHPLRHWLNLHANSCRVF